MKGYRYGILFTLLAVTLIVSPVFSQEKGKGKGKGRQDDKQTVIGEPGQQLGESGSSQGNGKGMRKDKQLKDKKHKKQAATVKQARQSGSSLQGAAGKLPPGLEKYQAKEGHLPPGLEKYKQKHDGDLPPGLENYEAKHSGQVSTGLKKGGRK